MEDEDKLEKNKAMVVRRGGGSCNFLEKSERIEEVKLM